MFLSESSGLRGNSELSDLLFPFSAPETAHFVVSTLLFVEL